MTPTDARYTWFSIPVQVKGIPADAGFVPVSLHIDFGSILHRLGQSGAVDECTLRLYRVGSESIVEEPAQFSPDTQPRHPQRHLSSGTPESVSWAGDWLTGEVPSTLNVSGVLTWIARDVCQYRLVFGVPTDGVFVQVPFPPNNLRHFDAESKSTSVRWFPRVQIRPQWPLDCAVNILQDGELFTSYHTGPTGFAACAGHRPYFYPVNGPDGVSLTELGKPHDPTGSHAHHYSLWIAHADVGGSDFWSERGGLIRHERFDLMEDGPIFARLIQRTRWVAGDEIKLRERRQLTFYAAPESFRLMDIQLEFSPGDSTPVELGKTPFGFLAARVAQSMTVFDGGGEIVNSEGQRNEQEAHWQRARWIDQSGPIIPGKWGGIALFDHPGNPGHPTTWHCRNDGWAGASFNFRSGWKIEPDNPLRLRYRVYLHRHDAKAGEVARRYEEYASEPNVQPGTPELLGIDDVRRL